jgi:hypothetical protein
MAGFFSGKKGGPFIVGRGSTRRGDLGRERGRCRQGREEGAALAGAAGCGVLWRAAGAMGEAEMVWFRGGHGRGPGCSSSMPSMSHGHGLGRGDKGSTRESPGHCWEVRE